MNYKKFGLRIYLYHFICVIAAFAITLPLWRLSSSNPYITTTITSIIYAYVIYSVAWSIGEKDARNLPGYEVDYMKPVKASVISAILPCLLYALRAIDFSPVEVRLEIFIYNGNVVSSLMDLIYKIYYFPFEMFMGAGNLFLYLLCIFPTAIFTILGYFAGTKSFRALAPLYNMIVYKNSKRFNNKQNSERKKK